MPDREPEPWESTAPGPFLTIWPTTRYSRAYGLARLRLVPRPMQDSKYDPLAEQLLNLPLEESEAAYAKLSPDEKAQMDARDIQTMWRSMRARKARADQVRLGIEKAMREAHARAEAKRNDPPPGKQ